jgi:hypothetical protein
MATSKFFSSGIPLFKASGVPAFDDACCCPNPPPGCSAPQVGCYMHWLVLDGELFANGRWVCVNTFVGTADCREREHDAPPADPSIRNAIKCCDVDSLCNCDQLVPWYWDTGTNAWRLLHDVDPSQPVCPTGCSSDPPDFSGGTEFSGRVVVHRICKQIGCSGSGSGSSFSDCVNTGCCGCIPRTLHLTVAASCGCGDLVIVLTYAADLGGANAGRDGWAGSGSFCGRTLSFALACCGTDSSGWRFSDTISGGCYGGSIVSLCGSGADFGAGHVCDPFMLTSTAHSIGDDAACGCGAGATVSYTVTT